jgi:hypothetical protein
VAIQPRLLPVCWGVSRRKSDLYRRIDGGTEAIKEILVHMPTDSPAIVITQHMPAGFTTSFAARLNSLCQITVKEAVNGERILPGHAYIAPGKAIPYQPQWSQLCGRGGR